MGASPAGSETCRHGWGCGDRILILSGHAHRIRILCPREGWPPRPRLALRAPPHSPAGFIRSRGGLVRLGCGLRQDRRTLVPLGACGLFQRLPLGPVPARPLAAGGRLPADAPGDGLPGGAGRPEFGGHGEQRVSVGFHGRTPRRTPKRDGPVGGRRQMRGTDEGRREDRGPTGHVPGGAREGNPTFEFFCRREGGSPDRRLTGPSPAAPAGPEDQEHQGRHREDDNRRDHPFGRHVILGRTAMERG